MLELYKPEIEDLWFRQKLLGDEETMSYNRDYGGIVPFPVSRWQSWYDRWLIADESIRYYRYLKDSESGDFVGEAAYHYDEKLNEYLCDIIIHAQFRHKGYGKEGLDLLCKRAKENELLSLCDTIAIGNPSIVLFIKNGFKEEYRTDEYVFVRKTL